LRAVARPLPAVVARLWAPALLVVLGACAKDSPDDSEFAAGQDAVTADAASPDAGHADAGPADAGPEDAGPADVGPEDAGSPDAAPQDAGPIDTGQPDTGPPDTGPPGCKSASDCDDKNSCTIDVCNPSDGECDHKAHTGTCDDGDPCTVDDVCQGKTCVGGSGKFFTRQFAVSKWAAGAAVARGDGQLVVVGQAGTKATAFGVDAANNKTWTYAYATEDGEFKAVMPASGGGFALAGWRKRPVVGGSQLLFARIGKTGADQGWGKVNISDTDQQVRALVPTGAASVVGFAGYSLSAAGTWRAWYGRYDIGKHGLWGDMKKVGDFSAHRAAMAMTVVGNTWVLAGWSGKKGGKKQGWVYTVDASTLAAKSDWAVGSTEDDAFDAVAAMPAGGLLCGGWSAKTQFGGMDAWLVRLDAAGKQLWEKRLGTDAGDQVYGVVAREGGAMVVGATGQKPAGTATATMWRLDALGNAAWSRAYNKVGAEVAHTVLADGDGLLVGSFKASGGQRLLLRRTDAFGHASCATSGVCADKTLKACDDGKACTAADCDAGKGCVNPTLGQGSACGTGKVCSAGGSCG